MKTIKTALIQKLLFLGMPLCLAIALSPIAKANTYYIDYETGSDANAGTKASPWQYHPFMTDAWGSGLALGVSPYSYSHSAGDQFIFKGGVTWHDPSFVLHIQPGKGGSSGTPDYYGVDKTWYSGSSWSRPVFDLDGHNFGYFWLEANYVIIDNFEMTGFYWGPGQVSPESPPYGNLPCISVGSQDYVTVENCYFHGWTHDTFSNFYTNHPSGTYDNLVCVWGADPAGNYGCVVSNCVFDGSASLDGNGNSSGTAVKGLPVVLNCTMINMVSGVLSGTDNGNTQIAEVAYNTIGPIVGSFDIDYPVINPDHKHQHPNAVEQLTSGSIFIHNNYIFNANSVCIFVGNPGGPDYVYDNVIDQSYSLNATPIQCDARFLDEKTLYCYNNTIVSTTPTVAIHAVLDDSTTPHQDNTTSWYLVADNNHFIDGGIDSLSFKSVTPSPNHNVSTSGADYGYSRSTLWQPTFTSAPTVDAGTSLSSLSSTLPTITSDFFGVARPQGSGWDVGAFEYREMISVQLGDPSYIATQTGPAVIGVWANDIWNQLLFGVGGDEPPTFPLDVNLNLNNVFGNSSDATISLYDYVSEPSSAGGVSSDYPMLLHSLGTAGEDFQLSLSLPSGYYDIYVYSALTYGFGGNEYAGSTLQIVSGVVGVSDYSGYVQSTTTGNYDINSFVAGNQYVLYSNVQVDGDTPLVIQVSGDLEPSVNGLQILKR